MQISLRLGDAATFEAATVSTVLPYDYEACPAPPARVAGLLAEHFKIEGVFSDGGVAGGTGNVSIKWPRHRAQRKPIKMALKEGLMLEVEPVKTYRASGDAICEACGKEFRKHPADMDQLSYTGDPYLLILCNGDRVKL